MINSNCEKQRYMQVVEIDPKRAYAAYSKTLDELEAIWPNVIAKARAADDEYRQKYNDAKAAHELREIERHQEYRKRMDEYMRKLKEWRNRSIFSFLKEPYPPDEHFQHEYCGMRSIPLMGWEVDQCESLKERINYNKLLASVAIPPYSIDGAGAALMAICENGAMIAMIKRKCGID